MREAGRKRRMLTISEVIVVEGKRDTVSIRRAVRADTIETGGSAIGKDVLAAIGLAAQRRGIIILTDPDYAGERIRSIVASRIPGCKHAFLAQEEATLRDDIGVENASPEAIRRALATVRTEAEAGSGWEPDFGWAELYAAGLAGSEGSAERRLRVGRKLRIGYANAKTFLNRCRMFRIGRAELEEALSACGFGKAAGGGKAGGATGEDGNE